MEIFAHILGFGVLILSLYSLTKKDDKKLTFYQIIVNLLLIPHFLLLGSTQSAIAAAIICVRVLAAYKYNNNYTYLFFMSAGFLHLSWAFYTGIDFYEYFPIISGIIVTHTYFKLTQIKMRVCFIIGGVCWIIAGIGLGSYSVAIINFLGILMHISTIYRINKDNIILKEKEA